MNILILGGGNGSWAVRGHQLGQALEARVATTPTRDLLRWADVVVLVKRADPTWAAQARALGKPVVWDALDFWQQPEQNALPEAEARSLLVKQMAIYQPDLVIGATQSMAGAAGGAYLPHHARPGLRPAPVRSQVTTVAYEGTKKYLGRWYRAIETACQARNWRFVVNPPDLRDADIVVAFRDGPHDGWMCREWKSGVKIVNAITAGRPILSQASAAWRELMPAGSLLETTDGLDAVFDHWADREARAQVVVRSTARWDTWTLATVSARYLGLLRRVCERQAAVA